jgi:cytoskeleton protein RodZ
MSEPQHPTPFGGQSVGHVEGRADNLASAATAASSASLDSVAAVGARLTMLREAKNWSIDDVSARLKVSPLKLRALENGDLSLFPDRNFATGIVRSYAKIMGADPAPFTQALRNANGPLEQNLSLPASSGAGLPRGRVSVPLGGPAKRRSWLWGLAAVIVAMIALGMWHTGGDSSAWLARLKASAGGATGSSGAPGNETSAASSVATPDENAAAGVGGTSAGSSVEVANAASGATGDAGTAQPMPHPLGTDAQPSTSSNVTGGQGSASQNAKTAAPAAALAQASGAAAAAGAPATPVGTGANALELKVTSDSWFSVREKSGKEVFSGLVHAGSVQRVEGDAPFKVTVGNRAGLESLTFDGQPVEPAKFGPAKGNVARFSLP